MDFFEPASQLSFEDNIAERWRSWKQELMLYLTATEKEGKDNKIKTSILLHCIGKQGREIYNTFTWSADGDEMKFGKVIEKFDAYCEPRKNLTFIRHKFFTYKQQDGQSFDDFVTELKSKAIQCEFGDLKDQLVKDMIVCGVMDKKLKERLLRENLTYR